MAKKPHIVILGAGPAGLGAAFQLTYRGLANVTVLEQSEKVGGIAGSFELSGLKVDYGSHRLHPDCDIEILHDIQKLLGDGLLDRCRHGRIRLLGKWIHFPLKPIDLLLQLPLGFALGSATDLMSKILKKRHDTSHNNESFASVLEGGLGKTICRNFYFPYAQKIWGVSPDELSVTQAERRVAANSIRKMFQKILFAVPGIKAKKGGRFFYPVEGFGQICESLCKIAKEKGADIILDASFKSLLLREKKVQSVTYVQDNKINSIEADFVWSTIPNTLLIQSTQPSPPPDVIDASRKLEHRAMILIYLVLEQNRFTEYDAHYFPDLEIPITRISEPKNYSDSQIPQNTTVLCAELPCSTADPEWHMTDEDLGKLVYNSLELSGIPVKAPVTKVVTQRLQHAYPIYQNGYEVYFDQIDQWLGQIENLLTFGRQGLFAHDNTHHALYMAYAAVKCLNEEGYFDHNRWQNFRHEFDTHVVVD